MINVCADQRLLDSLRDCNKLLDLVQKGLSEYLETKRSAFPRWVLQLMPALCMGAHGVGGPMALSKPRLWGVSGAQTAGVPLPDQPLPCAYISFPLVDSTSCQMMSCWRFCPRRRTPRPCSPTCASASRTLPGWVLDW